VPGDTPGLPHSVFRAPAHGRERQHVGEVGRTLLCSRRTPRLGRSHPRLYGQSSRRLRVGDRDKPLSWPMSWLLNYVRLRPGSACTGRDHREAVSSESLRCGPKSGDPRHSLRAHKRARPWTGGRRPGRQDSVCVVSKGIVARPDATHAGAKTITRGPSNGDALQNCR